MSEYLSLHSAFCHSGSCGPSWRLYFFYFGSCFIAIGSALYAYYCPKLIKRYRDAANFFDAEKVFLSHSSSLAHLFDRIEDVKGSPATDPLGLKKLIENNSGLDLDKINLLAGPMSEHYYLENRLNAPARFGVAIAYRLGGLMLVIPAIVTAWQIVQIIYRSILRF